MSQTQYRLTSKAYQKIILHCGKYPASSLLGLLIGKQESESSVVIEDVVPLAHKWTSLTPMVEVASALVEAHLSSQSDLSIIGCYEAPARKSAREASPATLHLAQSIANRLANSKATSSALAGQALILFVLNSQLLSSTSVPFGLSIQPSFAVAKGVQPPAARSVPTASLTIGDAKGQADSIKDEATKAAKAIQDGASALLADFDDHLTNPSQDWISNSNLRIVA